MNYYKVLLSMAVSEGWFDERSKFALFRYYPDAAHVIKAGMKDGLPDARDELGRWLRGTLPGLCGWFGANNCVGVVAIPGHKPSTDEPTPSSWMCELIERHTPLAYFHHALARTATVPSYFHHRKRPGYDRHVATMEWRGPSLAPGQNVLIFDDQYTEGDTSRAAAEVVRRATGASSIGLFLSRSRARLARENADIKRAKSP